MFLDLFQLESLEKVCTNILSSSIDNFIVFTGFFNGFCGK